MVIRVEMGNEYKREAIQHIEGLFCPHCRAQLEPRALPGIKQSRCAIGQLKQEGADCVVTKADHDPHRCGTWTE